MGAPAAAIGPIRALVVEDDPDVRSSIEAALRAEGFHVRSLPDGHDVDQAMQVFRPDIAILDVSLDGHDDGFTIARRIRAGSDIPFVFVTSSGALEDRLRGFEVGGDDYLVKPFAMAELLCRVRAVLRRSNEHGRSVWAVGDLVVDEDAHTLVLAGHGIEVTALEFALLVALARRPGRVMSKVQLLTQVWGFDHYSLNLVEVHVSALRKKLEAHAPRIIHTVRGVGYVLRA